MSITANYPNVRPSLLLDFANSQQLDQRITFSRSTTAPYYDGKTSVLAEQNLFTYSQLYTDVSWTKYNSTATANVITAPDGTTTGNSLIPTTASNSHALIKYGCTAGITYTLSIYAQSFGYNFIYLEDGGVSPRDTWFNLLSGTVGTTNANHTPVITALSGGWYRCSITFLCATTGNIAFGVSATNGVNVFTGDGTSGIYTWGAQLEQRSSATAYNATTTSAITNYIPQLLTAPINAPRFDFNPTTGESLGLLIEQSSTNLLTYSQDFSNAAWTVQNGTITTLANIAPDGTQTAQKFVPTTTASTFHRFYQTLSLTASTTYTISFYAKSAGYNYINYTDVNGGGNPGPVFDLLNGVASGTGKISSVGNGWYRCSYSFTAAATISTQIQLWVNQSNTGNQSYTGDGYSGIYIWGAQLEALAFPTSYIPTTSAQVTRAADVPPLPTSGWFNSAQGTFYTEIIPLYTIGTNRIQTVSSNVSSLVQYLNNSTGALQTFDGTNFALTSNAATANTSNKLATTYSTVSNNLTACLNGSTVAISSAYNNAFANASNIWIGTSGGALNGRIKKLAYYPQALTSAQLQALTGS